MSYPTNKTAQTCRLEDASFSEDEECSLSVKLSNLTQIRLQKLNISSPENTKSPFSALTFDSLIKKNPFETDFKFKPESRKSSSEVSARSTDQNSKPGFNFTKALKQQTDHETVGVVRAIYSADISFDGSPRLSESGIIDLKARDKRANSVDVQDPASLRKGILKLGTRSRFFKDTDSKDPPAGKLSKSTKSSSFRLPKNDKSKPTPVKGNMSPFKKTKTLQKR